MQTKTIKKNIQNKIEDWVNSIDNKQLRDEVLDNCLVSGGCITSMFLNENVNDYDVYISNVHTLRKIAEYYCNPFKNTITVYSGDKKNEYLSDIDEDYKKANIDSSSGIGYKFSFLRNLKEDQVKIYFESKSSFFRPDNSEIDVSKKYFPVHFSANSISLEGNIQIVLRFTGDNIKIHESFDFIHATNYWTKKEGLVTNKEALESIITKRLKYQGSLYPLTSIVRVRKFLKRNWNIGAGELLKIMFQISELDLKNPDVLEEQLTGVDVAYFSQLVDALILHSEKNVDFTLTSQYLNVLIDRMFEESEEVE